MGETSCVNKEKSERRHADSKPVIAKYCRALLLPDKIDINYIALRVIHPLF